MIEEQIRQNAEEYADEHCVYEKGNPNFLELEWAYIAGAHIHDKEIEDLKFRLKDSQNVIRLLQSRIDELCHPWISVEERLPEEHSKVLIMFCNGTVTYNDCIGVGDINYMKAHSKTITHWMPIPELEKGE